MGRQGPPPFIHFQNFEKKVITSTQDNYMPINNEILYTQPRITHNDESYSFVDAVLSVRLENKIKLKSIYYIPYLIKCSMIYSYHIRSALLANIKKSAIVSTEHRSKYFLLVSTSSNRLQ